MRSEHHSLDLTPRRIVAELDRYIVGQERAKRTVAIALRNRWRRTRLDAADREEVAPKNIMLIGPTGVGKTEIARRMAQLVGAPFLKVEATKYTEVGYVGRNVDSMIRDLVENSVSMVRAEEMLAVEEQAGKNAQEKIVALLMSDGTAREETLTAEERASKIARQKEDLRRRLADGSLDSGEVEVTVEERQMPFLQLFTEAGMEELGLDMGTMFGSAPKRAVKRVTVREAKKIVAQQEAEKLIDREKAAREGLRRAQEEGVIFIDEMDKIVSSGRPASGPDISREGVQRDLLPLVEGATVSTRYGAVSTRHILFIAAGAFSTAKPTDLIPELQGRFPLRAELDSLTRDDFVRILTEPKNALTKQYTLLLAAENIQVDFPPDGVAEMAALAFQANRSMQDIGARRLYTILERVLEEISFSAPDIAPARISITAEYVRNRLKDVLENEDVRKYIL